MYKVFINIHIWASILFSLTAIVLCLYYIKSIITETEFSKFHLFLENTFIGLLYFGLILGIILYFFIRSNYIVSNQYTYFFVLFGILVYLFRIGWCVTCHA